MPRVFCPGTLLECATAILIGINLYTVSDEEQTMQPISELMNFQTVIH